MQKEDFMRLAIEEAKKSAAMGEVPVGAVIVRNDEVIASACNRRESTKNALSHAETEAIYEACRVLGGWRLWECEMYVTLEPCPMCAGAILNARLKKVTFGAFDDKNGALASVFSMYDQPFTFRPEWEGGVLEAECANILSEFFRKLREERKAHPKKWQKSTGFGEIEEKEVEIEKMKAEVRTTAPVCAITGENSTES